MQTYDRYTEAFPDKANVNEVVIKAGDVRSGEGAAVVDRIVTGTEGSETFIGAPDVTYSDDGTVANVAVPSEGNGTDDASIAALGRAPRRASSRPRSPAPPKSRQTSPAVPPRPRTSTRSSPSGCRWCSPSSSGSRSC